MWGSMVVTSGCRTYPGRRDRILGYSFPYERYTGFLVWTHIIILWVMEMFWVICRWAQSKCKEPQAQWWLKCLTCFLQILFGVTRVCISNVDWITSSKWLTGSSEIWWYFKWWDKVGIMCNIYILTTTQTAIQQAIMLIPAWSLINLNTARKYLCKYELAINVLFSVAAPGVCSFEGQFLPVTGNRCVYIECVVVREPWQDAQGNIQLDMIQRQCAGGSGLPLNYVTGTENPCTVMLAECAPCEC